MASASEGSRSQNLRHPHPPFVWGWSRMAGMRDGRGGNGIPGAGRASSCAAHCSRSRPIPIMGNGRDDALGKTGVCGRSIARDGVLTTPLIHSIGNTLQAPPLHDGTTKEPPMHKIVLALGLAAGLAVILAACGDQGYGPTYSRSARYGDNATAATAVSNNGSSFDQRRGPAAEGLQPVPLTERFPASPARSTGLGRRLQGRRRITI